MMRFGSLVFALLKKNQQKEILRKIDIYIVFTKKSLELQLGKPISYMASLELFKQIDNKNVEIIFDTDDFSYQEIINFMQSNKSQNITYKNFFPSSNFIIGSNSSNDRGEVKLL